MSNTNFSCENSLFLWLSFAVIALMYYTSRHAAKCMLGYGASWETHLYESDALMYLLLVFVAWFGSFVYISLTMDSARVRLGAIFVSYAVVAAICVHMQVHAQLVTDGATNLVCNAVGGDHTMLFRHPFHFGRDKLLGECSDFMVQKCGVHAMVFSRGHNWLYGELYSSVVTCLVRGDYALFFLEGISASRNAPGINMMLFFLALTGTSLSTFLEVVARASSNAAHRGISILRIGGCCACIVLINITTPSWINAMFMVRGSHVSGFHCFTVFVSCIQCFCAQVILRTLFCFAYNVERESFNAFVSSLVRFFAFSWIYMELGGPVGMLPYMDPFVFVILEIFWDNEKAVAVVDDAVHNALPAQHSMQHMQQISWNTAAAQPPVQTVQRNTQQISWNTAAAQPPVQTVQRNTQQTNLQPAANNSAPLVLSSSVLLSSPPAFPDKTRVTAKNAANQAPARVAAKSKQAPSSNPLHSDPKADVHGGSRKRNPSPAAAAPPAKRMRRTG